MKPRLSTEEDSDKPGPKLTGLRVVVADDNPDIVLTLRVLLEQDGHVVRTFASGAGVVDGVREFRPDACVLDIEMPTETGYSIARELRAQYGTLRPIIIGISGKWYNASAQLLALNCGFDHFLEKPAQPSDLARILDDISRRRSGA